MHVTTRLERLHAAGLVHRDLKPGNILWRPKHLEWTLIDFGCAAQIGTQHVRIPQSICVSLAFCIPVCHKALLCLPPCGWLLPALCCFQLAT